ncbi:MAG: hypothetical protein IT475_06260 [Aquimonas sp.]|nr:hypothetical protein [Aquimonas sp.]
MSRTIQVVVEGGGENLYEINESGNRFSIYKIKVNLLFNARKGIGTTGSLENALALIRSHSGKSIKSVD